MKRFALIVFSLLLFTIGCDNIMNTPTKRVEEFLGAYQRHDTKVMSQLDSAIRDGNYSFNEEQTLKYKELMKKQYKDLTYIIKEETIDGNDATVTVEIEVYDYSRSISDAEDYFTTNTSEFSDNTGNVDNSKYLDYKLKQIENTTDRIKYTLNLTLSKIDKKWSLNDITESDRQKIHGIYNS